jgi:hypothetical protein
MRAQQQKSNGAMPVILIGLAALLLS